MNSKVARRLRRCASRMAALSGKRQQKFYRKFKDDWSTIPHNMRKKHLEELEERCGITYEPRGNKAKKGQEGYIVMCDEVEFEK